jgi:catechol 2,3-dioxygenase-like lactoylglutathione lyase family enzyme
MMHAWRPPDDPDRRAQAIAFYVEVLGRDFLDDYAAALYIARLNACLGHVVTSDGVPWLDLAQVEGLGDATVLPARSFVQSKVELIKSGFA